MSVPSLSLAGKVAIVSGARRGIAKAIALTFAEAGADVAVCDVVTDGGELKAVADEIEQLGRRSLAVQTDISSKTDVDNLVKQVMDKFGAIDILANCAAITKWVPLMELEEEDLDRFIDVDLKGYILCSQAVGKIMIKQKSGNIISIASTASFKPILNRGVYDVVKAGVFMLTKHLAKELAPHNIRANAIAPGVVKTEFTRPLWTNPDLLRQEEAKIPLGRLGETTDISKVALFLASDLAGYVTGHTVLADGGFVLL